MTHHHQSGIQPERLSHSAATNRLLNRASFQLQIRHSQEGEVEGQFLRFQGHMGHDAVDDSFPNCHA
jgi:hypothetical protein